MSNTITLPDGKVSIPSNGSIQFLHWSKRAGFRQFALMVSIPSNGSIQFLHKDVYLEKEYYGISCLNPLKRVNSILTLNLSIEKIFHFLGLNPLKRVNSILTLPKILTWLHLVGSQSPQTGQFNSYPASQPLEPFPSKRLNPLKRVNSILTFLRNNDYINSELYVSIPSNGSIQFLRN